MGNQYSGNLINITFIQGLSEATMSSTLIPARDEETDEELRSRYFEALNQKAFGGNIADYRTKVEALTGVGAVQVYPVWNGGGTVKLSVVDPSYMPCSDEFLRTLQIQIDPENANGDTGTGLGIAPIGHQVTVVTPDEVVINVEATVTLQAGYSKGQVEQPIKNVVEEYLQSLRQSWADASDLNIYATDVFVARVTAAMVSVPGVANVSHVTLNGSANDIFLTQNGQIQQLPILGEVVVNV